MAVNIQDEIKESKLQIRVASPNDAQAILDIYRYYVENTAVTFEVIAPTVDEIRNRISKTLERYPYFVAVFEDRVIGFAYAGPFKPRQAYDWSVETTVYISSTERGNGVGSILYETLEDALRQMGILNVYACVACSESADEYLTDASFRFHEREGYVKVGKFHNCGSKFGCWYSMTWMGKTLGPHNADPAPIRPFRG